MQVDEANYLAKDTNKLVVAGFEPTVFRSLSLFHFSTRLYKLDYDDDDGEC